MYVAQIRHAGRKGIGISQGAERFSCVFPEGKDDLDAAVLDACEKRSVPPGAVELAASELEFLPPLRRPPKIICAGLNYSEHSKETGNAVSTYPALFARFASGLVGHGQPIVRPAISDQLDYEGELVAVIGRPGRRIKREDALGHVLGYSLFNDGSIRDYQLRTSQWTVGKNFDGTGAFGPWIVTADQLPPGAANLRLETRLNGEVVQSASTNDLIFNVETLVCLLSEAFTLERGDVIVTGTPSGVGLARKPPLWMKPGDTCVIEIEGIGVLSNPIVQET
jgi:acylpyruvate hydrolase